MSTSSFNAGSSTPDVEKPVVSPASAVSRFALSAALATQLLATAGCARPAHYGSQPEDGVTVGITSNLDPKKGEMPSLAAASFHTGSGVDVPTPVKAIKLRPGDTAYCEGPYGLKSPTVVISDAPFQTIQCDFRLDPGQDAKVATHMQTYRLKDQPEEPAPKKPVVVAPAASAKCVEEFQGPDLGLDGEDELRLPPLGAGKPKKCPEPFRGPDLDLEK